MDDKFHHNVLQNLLSPSLSCGMVGLIFLNTVGPTHINATASIVQRHKMEKKKLIKIRWQIKNSYWLIYSFSSHLPNPPKKKGKKNYNRHFFLIFQSSASTC